MIPRHTLKLLVELVQDVYNALKGHPGTGVLIYFFLSLPFNFLELALSFVLFVLYGITNYAALALSSLRKADFHM